MICTLCFHTCHTTHYTYKEQIKWAKIYQPWRGLNRNCSEITQTELAINILIKKGLYKHMRFCDLFISYKIGLKSIKSTIPFTKLPLYRKIFVIIVFASAITSGILLILQKTWASYIPIGLGALTLIAFFIIDSTKRNLEVMLNEHYTPYSQKRMLITINVLKKYEIDIHNNTSIDMLIEEAKLAQIQCDYIAPLKKPLKTLGAIIVPIIAFVAQKIGNAATTSEMINMAAQVIVLVLLTFSLILSLTPIIKNILYRDYNKYDDLIYDLRQIKLFYAKGNDAHTT